MKVVQVLPFYLPESIGGTEVYVWSLCQYLKKAGITVKVLVPNYFSSEEVVYEYDSVQVTKYPEPTKVERLHKMGLALPDGLIHFKEWLTQEAPDVVHFHGLNGGSGLTVAHMEICKELGIDTYYTMHLAGQVCRAHTLLYKDKEICDGIIRPSKCAVCTIMHQQQPWWMAKILTVTGRGLHAVGIDAGYWNSSLGTGISQVNRMFDMKHDLERIARSCNKVIVVSDWFKKVLLSNGFPADKVVSIKQALPYGRGEEQPEPVRFNHKDAIKIVYAGRIHPIKGTDVLLEALKDIPEEKIELSIYGRQEDEQFYNHCFELSKGKTNIHWRGLLPREKMLSVFGKHQILCLPSMTEMSSLVIQEAFAAGIPVLASNVSGNAEMITHDKNGLLFPFKSAPGLREQLIRLITQKELLPALTQNVKPPATFDRTGEEYVHLYNSNTKN